MPPDRLPPPDPAALCTACGLCCGGLFARIRLRSADLPLARRAGTPILERDGTRYAHLPCTFLDGTACTVYEQRYEGCRSFRCTLLRRYVGGEETLAAAQARVAEMRRLLAAARTDTDPPADRRARARAQVRQLAATLYARRYFTGGAAARPDD